MSITVLEVAVSGWFTKHYTDGSVYTGCASHAVFYAQVFCLHVCMYMYFAVRVNVRVKGPSFTCLPSMDFFRLIAAAAFEHRCKKTLQKRDSLLHLRASCPPGNFSEGVWHGRGTLLASGDVYRGNWHQSLRHGQGDQVGPAHLCSRAYHTVVQKNDGRYVSCTSAHFSIFFCSKSLYAQIWSSNARYSGEFVHDVRCGYGIMRYENGDQYAGTWLDDRRHGEGQLTYCDGKSIFGEWSHDTLVRMREGGGRGG